ncbi:MAG: PEP-CTERM sorting domain-containing protein [Fimbriimonadaceae bacterium]
MKKQLIVLAFAAIGSQAFGQAAFWTGDTTGGPIWNRPTSFTSLSGVGTAVAYEVQPFFVKQDGQYVFEVDGITHTDTYALVYGPGFSPATPLADLKAGDDDFSGTFTVLSGTGQGFASSRIALGESTNYGGAATGLFLTAGVQYYAVVTGFGNTDFGTYNAGIGGDPGTRVNLGMVPEPGTMIALGAGLAALAARRRRK